MRSSLAGNGGGRSGFVSREPIVDDLTSLSEFTEDTIIDQLVRRYETDTIYTNIGSILISVNPYKQLPLYRDEVLKRYSNLASGAVVPPHVYEIASAALNGARQDQKCQSIVISGESGAGKTEASKIILRYLSEVAGGNSQSQIEAMILESNPLLEAFGNAKTLRNDNSSRFGKFMEITLDNGRVSGARLTNYLLEKSRVIQLAKGERSYHIFYQMLAGLSSEEKAALHLASPKEYKYLSQSSCYEVIDVNDAEKFKETRNALRNLRISDEQVNNIHKLLAMILNLGNIELMDNPDEEGTLVKNPDQLTRTAACMDLDSEVLTRAITHRSVTIVGETSYIPLRCEDSTRIRDTLAKHMYARLFDWLLGPINKALSVSKSTLTIGILDIFGFEVFKENLFEQLCINYANEKLQQHFINHIFRQEQEEYVSEDINFEQVKFIDNQECLNLIEGKRGILPELDEQVLIPQGNDDSFVRGITERYVGKHNNFKVIRQRPECFTVVHYAGEVSYSSTGMVEKDRDSMHTLCAEAMYTSKCSMMNEVMEDNLDPAVTYTRRRETLASQFRRQLTDLVGKLTSSSPHFVRCVKPNANKARDEFDANMVLGQLSYAGLFEALRIRKAGYAYRRTFDDFAHRFGLIWERSTRRKISGPTKSQSQEIIKLLEGRLDYADDIQVGRTKVFFREQSNALLENARDEAIVDTVILIQRWGRGFVARLRFKKMKELKRRLDNLIAQRDLQQLRRAVDEAYRGKIRIYAMAQAKAVVEQLEEELRLFDLLRDAADAEDRDLLEQALARADRARLTSTCISRAILDTHAHAVEVLDSLPPRDDPRGFDPLLRADLQRLEDALERGNINDIEEVFVSSTFAEVEVQVDAIDEGKQQLFEFWANQIEVLLSTARSWEFPDVDDDGLGNQQELAAAGFPNGIPQGGGGGLARVLSIVVSNSVEDLLNDLLNKITDSGFRNDPDLEAEIGAANEFLAEQEALRSGQSIDAILRQREQRAAQRSANKPSLLDPFPIEPRGRALERVASILSQPRNGGAPLGRGRGAAGSSNPNGQTPEDYQKQIEVLLTTARNFNFPDVEETDSAGLQRVLSNAGIPDRLLNNVNSFPARLLSNAVSTRVEELLENLMTEIVENGVSSDPILIDEFEAAKDYLIEQEANRTGRDERELRAERDQRERRMIAEFAARPKPMPKPMESESNFREEDMDVDTGRSIVSDIDATRSIVSELNNIARTGREDSRLEQEAAAQQANATSPDSDTGPLSNVTNPNARRPLAVRGTPNATNTGATAGPTGPRTLNSGLQRVPSNSRTRGTRPTAAAGAVAVSRPLFAPPETAATRPLFGAGAAAPSIGLGGTAGGAGGQGLTTRRRPIIREGTNTPGGSLPRSFLSGGGGRAANSISAVLTGASNASASRGPSSRNTLPRTRGSVLPAALGGGTQRAPAAAPPIPSFSQGLSRQDKTGGSVSSPPSNVRNPTSRQRGTSLSREATEQPRVVESPLFPKGASSPPASRRRIPSAVRTGNSTSSNSKGSSSNTSNGSLSKSSNTSATRPPAAPISPPAPTASASASAKPAMIMPLRRKRTMPIDIPTNKSIGPDGFDLAGNKIDTREVEAAVESRDYDKLTSSLERLMQSHPNGLGQVPDVIIKAEELLRGFDGEQKALQRIRVANETFDRVLIQRALQEYQRVATGPDAMMREDVLRARNLAYETSEKELLDERIRAVLGGDPTPSVLNQLIDEADKKQIYSEEVDRIKEVLSGPSTPTGDESPKTAPAAAPAPQQQPEQEKRGSRTGSKLGPKPAFYSPLLAQRNAEAAARERGQPSPAQQSQARSNFSRGGRPGANGGQGPRAAARPFQPQVQANGGFSRSTPKPNGLGGQRNNLAAVLPTSIPGARGGGLSRTVGGAAQQLPPTDISEDGPSMLLSMIPGQGAPTMVPQQAGQNSFGNQSQLQDPPNRPPPTVGGDGGGRLSRTVGGASQQLPPTNLSDDGPSMLLSMIPGQGAPTMIPPQSGQNSFDSNPNPNPNQNQPRSGPPSNGRPPRNSQSRNGPPPSARSPPSAAGGGGALSRTIGGASQQLPPTNLGDDGPSMLLSMIPGQGAPTLIPQQQGESLFRRNVPPGGGDAPQPAAGGSRLSRTVGGASQQLPNATLGDDGPSMLLSMIPGQGAPTMIPNNNENNNTTSRDGYNSLDLIPSTEFDDILSDDDVASRYGGGFSEAQSYAPSSASAYNRRQLAANARQRAAQAGIGSNRGPIGGGNNRGPFGGNRGGPGGNNNGRGTPSQAVPVGNSLGDDGPSYLLSMIPGQGAPTMIPNGGQNDGGFNGGFNGPFGAQPERVR